MFARRIRGVPENARRGWLSFSSQKGRRHFLRTSLRPCSRILRAHLRALRSTANAGTSRHLSIDESKRAHHFSCTQKRRIACRLKDGGQCRRCAEPRREQPDTTIWLTSCCAQPNRELA